MIAIHNAHLYWDLRSRQLQVHSLGSAGDIEASNNPKLSFNTGACRSDWKTRSESSLVDELTEFALNRIVVDGFDAFEVIATLLNIQEFYLAADTSPELERVISHNLLDTPCLDLRRWGPWEPCPAPGMSIVPGLHLAEHLLALIVVDGFCPEQLIKEYLKFDEYRREGARSYYLARVFSFAVDGQASDDLERWA